MENIFPQIKVNQYFKNDFVENCLEDKEGLENH